MWEQENRPSFIVGMKHFDNYDFGTDSVGGLAKSVTAGKRRKRVQPRVTAEMIAERA